MDTELPNRILTKSTKGPCGPLVLLRISNLVKQWDEGLGVDVDTADITHLDIRNDR